MAIDNTGLVYLLDSFWQGENLNGKPLVGGYMCVYIAGTDTKYITYQNFDGTRNSSRFRSAPTGELSF